MPGGSASGIGGLHANDPSEARTGPLKPFPVILSAAKDLIAIATGGLVQTP